jgi:hypothetical protein
MEKNEILVVYGGDTSGMANALAHEAKLAELKGKNFSGFFYR